MLTGIVDDFVLQFSWEDQFHWLFPKYLVFLFFMIFFFCGILWKYKLDRKILVFDVFLFEEKFTYWKSLDDFWGEVSYWKLGEYRILLVKQ